MKITNKQNLPEPIVRAVYSPPEQLEPNTYRVTTLLRPARIVALEKKYEAYLETDASDLIYRLLGQAMHQVLERAGVPERRYGVDVEVNGNLFTVTGKPDRFQNGVLEDYKVTSAWRALNETVPDDYVQQLNLYAFILRRSGFKVSELRSVMILRDWSKLEALRNESYPHTQTVTRTVTLWSDEHCETFLKARIAAHEAAKTALPLCTKQEQWAKADQWAVMPKGLKRAKRVFNNEQDAVSFRLEQSRPLDFYIQFRPGEQTRCLAYCPVSKWCDQVRRSHLRLIKQGQVQ